MNWTKNSPTLLVVWILAAACAAPKGIEMVGVRNLALKSAQLTDAKVTGQLLVNNANPFPVRIKNLKAALSSNGLELGQYQRDSLLILPASALAYPVDFQVQLKVDGLLSGLITAFSTDSVAYSVLGTLNVGRTKPRWRVSFSQSGKVARKWLLQQLLEGGGFQQLFEWKERL